MNDSDDIFSRKVKEAFDHYDASHLADDGWNSYVSTHGTRRRRVMIMPLWARAASIAVLVAIGVLLAVRLNHPKAGEPADQVAQVTQGKQTTPEMNKEDTAALASESNATKSPINPAKPGMTAMKTVSPASNSGRASVKTVSEPLQNLVTGSELAGALVSESAAPVPVETVQAGEILSPETITAAEKSAAINAAGKPAVMDLPDSPAEIRLTANALSDMEPAKKLNLTSGNSGDYTEIPREKMTTTIMTGLSGMMASISDASSISQGVSIGFYVEQQLSRRISVRPGLAMARHSYAMEDVPVISGGALALDYAAPQLNGLSGTTTSYDANIDIVSIEVPVNFVISLRKRQRSNLFITTGASTLFYLSQHLTGKFNNTYSSTAYSNSGEVSYESITTSVQIESEQETLSRVDFMGLANFSAGYSLPFGKTSHLVFEPFVQLPVKDLTSLNLRIRYGGLSMKIQF